jgi:hypothetical protein
MNLLGMKRKLLPYGMPLGGFGGAAGSAMGAIGQAASNNSNTNSPAPSGGKSSGAGLGGYGAAPAFGGGLMQPVRQDMSTFNQPTAQTQPSTAQSPFPPTPLDSSINTTTSADMMGGMNRALPSGMTFGMGDRGGMPMMGGGKSSGLGQGGYGMAPAFGGDRGQMDFGVLRQPSQPMGGMGGFGQQRQATPEELEQQRLNPAPQLSPEESAAMAARRSEGFAGAPQLSNFGLAQRGGFGGQQFNPYQQFGGFEGLTRQGMGGQQPGAPMSFDEFKQSGMMLGRNQQYRTPEQEAALDQKNYQSYLAGPQAPTYGQGQTDQMGALNAMLAQQRMGGQLANNLGRNMLSGDPMQFGQPRQGGMGGMRGMGGLRQFSQPQQQPTPESLYAANMGMQPPQQFNQQRPANYGRMQQPQQPGRFQQQQPQQQSQDMRGLAQLLSLLRGGQG